MFGQFLFGEPFTFKDVLIGTVASGTAGYVVSVLYFVLWKPFVGMISVGFVNPDETMNYKVENPFDSSTRPRRNDQQ
jgi:N-acetylmuramic acid 6-phosphate (MurNAc-6-P) etherase